MVLLLNLHSVETGSNIKFKPISKDSSLDINRIKQCHAVLNLREDGVGILISDQSKTQVLALGNYSWEARNFDQGYINELEELLLGIEFNFEDCVSTHWVLSLKKSALIPSELFKTGEENNLLKFSTPLLADEVHKSSASNSHDITSYYSIPKIMDQWLSHNFSKAKISHISEAYINLYDHYPKSGTFALLHTENNHADLFIANQGRIILYNQFEYKVDQDLIYYLLFALEQNRILAPEIELILSGKAKKEGKLDILLKDYIGTVNETKIPNGFSMSSQLTSSTLKDLFNLLGGL